MNALIYPPPGTVVYVIVFGLFRHKGIVSNRWWRGRPMVLCNCWQHGVTELPWDSFSERHTVFTEGYPSKLPGSVVLHRARRMIGQRYDLLSFNCEHFVNVCHGLKPESRQVTAAIGAALTFGLLVLTVQT